MRSISPGDPNPFPRELPPTPVSKDNGTRFRRSRHVSEERVIPCNLGISVLPFASNLDRCPAGSGPECRPHFGGRVVAGYDQVHEAWSPQHPDVLSGNGRRLGGLYFSGGNGGYFFSGPGLRRVCRCGGAFMPYSYYGYRPWGFGYGFGAGGYWPGFGYGRYSYYFGRPAIYSANELWGNNCNSCGTQTAWALIPRRECTKRAQPAAGAVQPARPAKKPQPRLSNAEARSAAPGGVDQHRRQVFRPAGIPQGLSAVQGRRYRRARSGRSLASTRPGNDRRRTIPDRGHAYKRGLKLNPRRRRAVVQA